MSGRTNPGERERVVIAAATAGDGGGWLAVRSVIVAAVDRGTAVEVWLPSDFPIDTLPVGPTYLTFGRLSGLLKELIGPDRPDATCYVGMSDRLPLVRRPASSTLVLQNNFLYGRRQEGFPVRARLRLELLRGWNRLSARRADLVVSATTASVPDLLASTGVEPDRVQVRPIPPQDLPPPRTAQPPEVRRVVMVGTVYDYKRFDWAVRVVDQWAADHHPVELVHVGGIEEVTAGDNLERSAAMARHIQVELRGRADHDEAIAAIAGADLLLFPSLRESYGLPLAEALGLGVPAVCTDLPQFRELAASSAEYFVDEGTLLAALDRVQAVETRTRMAESGIERVTGNTGWDVFPATPADQRSQAEP